MPYQLAFVDRFRKVLGTPIESDTSNSVAFASLPSDVPTKMLVEWTGEQYKKLLSCVMAGADLLWADESDEIIWQLIKVVHQPITLEDEEDECINFLPSAPFVSFLPQNPYNEPDLVPSGYLVPPFRVNSDFGYPELFGYHATDVMVTPDSIPYLGGWDALLGLGFPTIKLSVRGQGQIELDLLSATIGGYAIVKVGSPPNIIDIIDGVVETGVVIVDLNQDAVALPIESDLIISEEINIDALDGTDVYIVFVPKIDDSLTFLGFGGGIRQIGLCGLEEMGEIMGIEDIRFNAETCTLEKRLGGEWSEVSEWAELFECIGAMMATQAEIKQAIIDAELELMSRALAGETVNLKSGILINKDFSKEVKGVDVPDDPVTVDRDEQLEAVCGGVISVEKGINEMLDYAYNTFGTDSTSDVTIDDFRYLMSTKYDCDATLMDDAVFVYGNRRTASEETINSLSVGAVQNKLFSKGNLKSVIVNYILTLTGNTLEARQACILFVQALNQSQLETWYNLGAQVPSNLYLGYPSSKLQIEEFELDMSLADYVEYPTFQLQKPNHRALFEVSGQFTSSDFPNIIMDYFYHIDTSTGVKTYVPSKFQLNCGGLAEPAQSQVPYSPSGVYAVTLDHPSAPFGGGGQMYIGRDNDYFDFADVTGVLTCKLTDLGEYIA